jgi:RNA polymerase sigma-70 factor (ECF subfamily)
VRHTDEELMAEFQNGDATCFDALLERYRGPVFAMIVNMLNDRIAAEDVFQEVFLKVIRSAQTYDPARAFAPWVFKIADNACMEAFRRRKDEAGDATETAAPESIEPERRVLLPYCGNSRLSAQHRAIPHAQSA